MEKPKDQYLPHLRRYRSSHSPFTSRSPGFWRHWLLVIWFCLGCLYAAQLTRAHLIIREMGDGTPRSVRDTVSLIDRAVDSYPFDPLLRELAEALRQMVRK